MFLTVGTLLLSCQVSAHPGSYNRSVITGEKELLPDWKIKIEYKITATVSHPSTLTPGETTKWTISLTGGEFKTSVYVPFPVSKWIELPSSDVPIGKSAPITYNGVTVEPTLTISASLNISGPADSITQDLLWESDGPKTFNVTANSDAEIRKTVNVTINAKTEIHTTITYSGFPLPDLILPRTTLGSFQFDPIVESMEVHPEVGNLHILVTDQEGIRISGATVNSTLNPSDQPTLNGTTDSSGYVVFDEVIAGFYKIEATKSGYVTGSQQLIVSPDQTKTEIVTLNKKTTPTPTPPQIQ